MLRTGISTRMATASCVVAHASLLVAVADGDHVLLGEGTAHEDDVADEVLPSKSASNFCLAESMASFRSINGRERLDDPSPVKRRPRCFPLIITDLKCQKKSKY